jgi:hypothetical protein
VRYAISLVLLLAGCSNTAWQLSAGQPPPVNSTVQVHGGAGLATALGLTILAAGAYEVVRSGVLFSSDSNRPPDMAPDRRVSEQDCSKPLDYTLGNIRCK